MRRILVLSLLTCSPLMAAITVPEIDPASGCSAVAFLAGCVLVIRGRIKK